MGHDPKARAARVMYDAAGTTASEVSWRPRADIYRTKKGWLIKFELAGVPAEDVSVFAQGRSLTVSGVRHDTVAERGCAHFLMEISYNRFERTVELPCEILSENLEIALRNGILLVSVTSNKGGQP